MTDKVLSSAIAIIGMACRVPGARDLNEFWDNLEKGRETVRESTDEELIDAGVPDEIRLSPDFRSSCGRLDGIEKFDAEFFDITPALAEVTSPQQRLLLEVSHLALEDSGYVSDRYDGRIGIHAAIESSDYEYENLRFHPELYEKLGHKSVQFANDIPFSATTVAYKLNLTGPAINVTTACSSSLVAIHTACQSLLNFEADMMLAGGASYYVVQHTGYVYQQGGIGSFDGHCRAFDSQASGTVSGNGAGMVLLKRLEDAQADGDDIYAVILGSAINNDGNQKVGYSAPGLQSQADVIADAQHIADVSAQQVSYVEAHGTGTPLGDPIEVAALTQAFRETSDGVNYCALGSLKSNIGHLACASGVSGMIKTVLALKHRCLPATLHVDQPNPQLNLSTSPFYLNKNTQPWQAIDGRRIAGVSSFGMGGTNVHVVVEEYQRVQNISSNKVSNAKHILPLSAKSQTSLRNNAVRLCKYLAANQDVVLADLAYTLQEGRDEYSYRSAFVVDNFTQALKQLQSFCKDIEGGSKQIIVHPSCVMVFPGQGNQFAGMASSLYQYDDTFSTEFDRCQKHLLQDHNIKLSDIVFKENDEARLIDQTQYTQISLFVIEYALAKSLMRYGVQPTAMIGHSIGEYVAATLSGVFSLHDALDLVVARGRLMQSMPSGRMASVHLSEQELLESLPEGIDIAAINRAAQTVISGPEALIDPFLENLEASDVRVHRLITSHAFHSEMMDGCLQDFETCMASIERHEPKIPFISNLTGTWITAEQALDINYWVRHLRSSVRFLDGLCCLSDASPNTVFLEVGPGQSAKSVFSEHHQLGEHEMFNLMSSPRNPKSDYAIFLKGLADIWRVGLPLKWPNRVSDATGEGISASYKPQRLHLPNYAYERKKYWVDAPGAIAKQAALRANNPQDAAPFGDQLGADDTANFLYAPTWQQQPARFSASSQCSKRPMHWIVVGDVGRAFDGVKESSNNDLTTLTYIDWAQAFGKIDANNYEVKSDSVDDYVNAFKELISASQDNITLVYAAGLSGYSGLEHAEAVRQGFYRLLPIVRALSSLDISVQENKTIQLLSLGTGLASISDQEHCHPVAAMTAVLTRCIEQEYPQLRCTYIDVDPSDRRWLAALIEGVYDGRSEPLMALRGRHWYLPSLTRVYGELDAKASSGVRQSGVYVISGGLTGIGYAIACYLAQHYQAKLVLLGRSAGQYPQSMQSNWPRAANDDPALIDKVIQLEKLGADVISLSVDVAEQSHLHQALALAEQHFGKINGVIHAAGIAGGGFLATLKEAQCDATFSAKISGSHHLMDYFKGGVGDALDFILLCSSRNAIKDGASRADYCVANAYMDALATNAEQNYGLPVISVNWSAWKDVGMLHDYMESQGHKLSKKKLAESLSTAEGLEIFEQITGLSLNRVVVLKEPLNMQRSIPDDENTPALTQPLSAVRDRPFDMSAKFAAADTEISQGLAAIWADALGVSPIGVDDDFFELGGNSLLSLQVAMKIQKQHGHQYDIDAFLTRPTIREFEDYILQQKTDVQDLDELEKLLDRL
jgi:acyl transferase domain-containing protein